MNVGLATLIAKIWIEEPTEGSFGTSFTDLCITMSALVGSAGVVEISCTSVLIAMWHGAVLGL
jgi:hypothetical protein